MADEVLVVDHDPEEGSIVAEHPVVFRLPDVPPRATSSGWGDMSWTKQ